jgi:SagB-type dehydrogenase family enzyme
LGHFRAILDSTTRPLPADFVGWDTGSLLGVYIIVNAVDGLPSGAYHYSQASGGLELLREGAFREEAGHLCFEQALGADAAAVMYYLADLDRLLERYGNRGYRAAQLESGVLVGNAYLCAHSLGLGATGMTFYDDAVTEFFSPHAQGRSVMFLVAVGATDTTNRVRPFRSRVGVLLDSLARGAGNPNPSREQATG